MSKIRSHHRKGYLHARSTPLRQIGFAESKCGRTERKVTTHKLNKVEKIAHKMRLLGEPEIARILESF